MSEAEYISSWLSSLIYQYIDVHLPLSRNIQDKYGIFCAQVVTTYDSGGLLGTGKLTRLIHLRNFLCFQVLEKKYLGENMIHMLWMQLSLDLSLIDTTPYVAPPSVTTDTMSSISHPLHIVLCSSLSYNILCPSANTIFCPLLSQCCSQLYVRTYFTWYLHIPLRIQNVYSLFHVFFFHFLSKHFCNAREAPSTWTTLFRLQHKEAVHCMYVCMYGVLYFTTWIFLFSGWQHKGWVFRTQNGK